MGQDRSDVSRFAAPGRLTSAGSYASLLDAVPSDPAGIARTIQGLLIHEHVAGEYGVTLTDADRQTVHLRRADELLARIAGSPDDQPLTVARTPEQRMPGNCRHYSLLMVTALRARGVPARARCGFGDYFVDNWYEDHWVAEYWSTEQARWIMVDAQLDARHHELLDLDFDFTDVPRDRFLVAGEAWARCRAGAADPDAFGLHGISEGGWWWIAGNLMRDAAALHGVELLPWDAWGVMPGPFEKVNDERAALFDELARLTREPDEHADELRLLYADKRLRVPAVVTNGLRARDEPI
ncbi:transglutaminase-like domain-containing protein [Micromonospora sp. CP22]|uniref:transglutaminase-like domain-containing protein n=1 Tax=Micromonospora sp. CP22 TaxID=2580517 RepID=UPI0012BCF3E5|nr:transglutaminase-like domain-containing protein [Micromonospora sp. CP22]MTK02696.1 transglutaminase domain-containing protein [Micromonospora sp. CP22]